MAGARFPFPSSRFVVFLSFLSYVCCGCASQAGFSKSFPKRLTETQQFWYFRTPANQRTQTASAGPLLSVSPLQRMLDDLTAVSPLKGYPVQAVVLNDPKINARTDGLTIYVNSGLLSLFRGQDDLIASVLGHELGHILANHRPEGKPRTSSLSYLSYLTPALGVLPYGSLYGSLAGTAIQQGVHIRDYSYDRLQENEADAIGAYLASKAGYNAMGLSQFLDHVGSASFHTPQTLSVPTSVSAIPVSAAVTLLSTSPLYRTHPPSNKRKKIVELVVRRSKGEINAEQMRRQSRWTEDLYETLEKRCPKNSAG